MNKNSRSSSDGQRNRTRSSTSNRGARPKMNQKSAFNKDSGAQGGFPCQLAKHIPFLWDNITFCFTETNQASGAMNFQPSLRLDIAKVQFALTSFRKEKYFGILKKMGIGVNVNDKHQIEIKFMEQFKEINDELKYLEKIFEDDIICDLESNAVDAKSPEGKKLIKEPHIKMKEKTVYHCSYTNNLYVVGEKSEKQMPLKTKIPDIPKSENKTHPYQKDLSLLDSFLMEYLGFKDHILNTFPGVQNPPICRVKSGGPNVNVDEEIRCFLKKVQKQKLAVSGDLVERLFFNKYPEPNDMFYVYIKKMFKRYFEKEAFFYISKSDTGEFFVNCVDEDEAQNVTDIVEKSIVSDEVEATCGEDGWNFLKEWSDKKMLFYNTASSGRVELCCTKDVHEKLQKMKMQKFDSSATLSLPDSQLRFLRSFGNDILVGVEEQFGVRATVKESELKLTGTLENLQKSEDFLKSLLRRNRKSVKLDVPIECIEDRQDEIDALMNKSNCVWDLKNMEKPVKMLKNCDYLASWIDPLREIKVTVVRGFSWHMNLDLQIVMTNQCLYPIDITQPQYKVPEDFISGGIDIIERKHRSLDVGEYTELPKAMDGCENGSCVALVVCSDLNSNTCKCLVIKQKIKEILEKQLKNNIKNFGINASEGDDAHNLTRQAIEAALEFADASTKHIAEIFICCQNEQTQQLRNVYELFKDKHGFFQKIYSDSAKMLRRAGSETKVKVTDGSLGELTADVMVNTTNKQLKLEKGRLSSKILEMAGPSLQHECKTKYPGGLKKRQVAKTNAYNFSNVGFLYHISLPDYNEATFREVVKMYVKKCLCQAERDGCCSIAFPALGVGQLKYPRRETAEAMFDAAEEYSLEVIKPVLKSIKFLVNVSDLMTHEAFRDEEYRRSKRCLNEIGLTKSNQIALISDFNFVVLKTDQERPSIKITTLEDFGVPPAYAIEVFIGYDETEEICRKRAFDTPPSWNDRWFLQRAENLNKVNVMLRKFIDKLSDDRVTEIVIYTNKGGKLAIDQRNSYSRSTELSIELIGKTKECLNKGEAFVENLVKIIKQDITTYLVSRLPKLQVPIDSLGSKNDFEVSDDVTAEINRGIVNFKKQNIDLDSWVSKVEKIFRLEVTASSDGKVTTVKGDFDSILRFEEYLDKHFPDDPPAIYMS